MARNVSPARAPLAPMSTDALSVAVSLLGERFRDALVASSTEPEIDEAWEAFRTGLAQVEKRWVAWLGQTYAPFMVEERVLDLYVRAWRACDGGRADVEYAEIEHAFRQRAEAAWMALRALRSLSGSSPA